MTSRSTGTRALAFCGLMSLALGAACNTGSSGGENLPYPGVPSGGSGGSAGGAAGGDGGPVAQGCLKCACYPNGTCNAGMVCISGTCTQDGCSSDSECAEGEKCDSGACVPEGCGDGKVAGSEECDDGNTVNGDGCNRRCAKESSGEMTGGDPIGAEPGSENLPVADQEECESETKNTAYAPGDELTLSICMISYADSNGSGLNKLEMVDAISKAGQFYAAAGAKIKLDATTEHALTEIAAPAQQTDPGSKAEVDKLMQSTWSRFETSSPGQCHVVVGFVNTMKNDSGSIGGQASKPDAAYHVVLVPVNHPKRAYSIAHELGHALGLKHTHETSSSTGDGCADTVKDPGCWETSSGCDATCSTGTPPAENVMSYYKCDVPSAESLTPCQVRRARCFATKLFPVNCPVPKLLTPTDGTVVAVGQKDVAFSWELGKSGVDHTLSIKLGNTVKFEENVGTATSKLAGGPSVFSEEGTYLWTVKYQGACCKGDGCAAVARTLEVQKLSCAGAASESCGNCGTRTRTCNSDGTWSEWGDCLGTGPCVKGTNEVCTTDGTTVRTCTDTCQWSPATCPGCTSHASKVCQGSNLVWQDSCGKLQETAATCKCGCQNNACLPEATATDICQGNDVYHKDECSNTTFTKSCECGCQNGVCNPTQATSTYCNGTSVYQTDQCGVSSFKQSCTCGCQNGTCTQTQSPSTYCSGDDVYQTDQCGVQSLKQSCTCTCQYGACTPTQSTSTYCSGTSVWKTDQCGVSSLYQSCGYNCSGGSCCGTQGTACCSGQCASGLVCKSGSCSSCTYSATPSSSPGSSSATYTCTGGVVMGIYGSIDSNGNLTVYGSKSGGFGAGTYVVRVFDPTQPANQQCKSFNIAKATKTLSSTSSSISFNSFASQLTCGGAPKAYCITKADGGDDAYWCSGKLTATYQ